MRSILLATALALVAAPAYGQGVSGSIGASATILAPERMEVGAPTQLARGSDGEIGLSAPLRLTQALRPLMLVQNEREGGSCELAPIGALRGAAGTWETRLRCTADASETAPVRVRLVTYNN